MRPNRFLQLLCLLPLWLAALGSQVLAGDTALWQVIGYSEDGRHFAFEEFGIQDGSGFAYASVYVVDLLEDRWVADTPVRVRAADEATPLATIRQQAQAEAAPILHALAITWPAQLLVVDGDGSIDQDGLTAHFGLPGFAGPHPVSGDYRLGLDIFKAEPGQPCMEWFGDTAMGFGLHIDAGAGVMQLYRDTELPKSRGCPITYRISAVYVPFHATELAWGVALISVYAHGFEGPDRRLIALPIGRGQDLSKDM